MELFDLHVDIGYDVMQKKHTETDTLNRFHLQKFLEGEVSYTGMASFFEGSETWDYMQNMVLLLKKEIEYCEMIDLVLCGEDLTENGYIKAILTVEGICGIKEHAREGIEWLYAQGVCIVSFCWGEENLLATGVKGDPEHGLHPLEKETLQVMIDCSILVDVSHANKRTFWDVMAHPSVRAIATHSNTRALCDHPRNFWDDQTIVIAKWGRATGMNSAPAFVHERSEKRDIPHLAAHIYYIKQLAGIEALALGLDHMDFYEGCGELHTKDLEDCLKSQCLIKEMLTRNFSEEEVGLIVGENTLRKLREVL